MLTADKHHLAYVHMKQLQFIGDGHESGNAQNN